MNRDEIIQNLNTKKLGRSLELFEVIDYSTNHRVRELLEAGAGDGTCVSADLQLGGRGRLGRSWDPGKAGEMLPLSVALEWKGSLDELPAVTLVAALGVRDGILELAPELRDRLLIKWPNDLLIDSRKVCGILTELCCSGGRNFAIVGIGINMSRTDFGQELSSATSLLMEGSNVSAGQLLAAVLNNLERRYIRFAAGGRLGDQASDYERALICMNKALRVVGDDSEYVCRGIDEQGRLLVETEGRVKALAGGEVSVRGDFYQGPVKYPADRRV